MTADCTIGEALVTALAAGNHQAASSLLSPGARLRAMTPLAVRDLSGPEATMAILGGRFPPGDVGVVDALGNGRIGDRHRVGYRVRWSTPERKRRQFEQAHLRHRTDGITWM